MWVCALWRVGGVRCSPRGPRPPSSAQRSCAPWTWHTCVICQLPQPTASSAGASTQKSRKLIIYNFALASSVCAACVLTGYCIYFGCLLCVNEEATKLEGSVLPPASALGAPARVVVRLHATVVMRLYVRHPAEERPWCMEHGMDLAGTSAPQLIKPRPQCSSRGGRVCHQSLGWWRGDTLDPFAELHVALC